MSRALRLIAVMSIAVLMVAGCTRQDPEFTAADQVAAADRAPDPDADPDPDAAPATTVTFVAEGIEFTDAPSEVPAGLVTFELRNESGLLHDVALEGIGVVVEAQGDSTETGNVELAPGEYTFYCAVPGHRNTMEGTFTVAE